MVKAKQCLELISTPSPELKQEENLISAFEQLADIGVQIHPVQLRLKKKEEIIKEVLHVANKDIIELHNHVC